MSSPLKIIEQSVRILRPSTCEEAVRDLCDIEYAGRNCYRSQDKVVPGESYERFIRNLLQRGHLSPLEFASMTVEIVTSRDVLCELTRHRLASFAVQSQRYVADDKTGEISFVKPEFYLEPDEVDHGAFARAASRQWDEAMEQAENSYRLMKETYLMNPEDARKVLPNSTACVICMRANLREWLHIMKLRSAPAAYPEIRRMMNLLISEAKQLYPFLFDNL